MSETDKLQEKQKLPIGFKRPARSHKIDAEGRFYILWRFPACTLWCKATGGNPGFDICSGRKTAGYGNQRIGSCLQHSDKCSRTIATKYISGASNRGNRTGRETGSDRKPWRKNLGDGNSDDTQTGEVSEPFGKVPGAGRYQSSVTD